MEKCNLVLEDKKNFKYFQDSNNEDFSGKILVVSLLGSGYFENRISILGKRNIKFAKINILQCQFLSGSNDKRFILKQIFLHALF